MDGYLSTEKPEFMSFSCLYSVLHSLSRLTDAHLHSVLWTGPPDLSIPFAFFLINYCLQYFFCIYHKGTENQNGYFVASQDRTLRRHLQKVPGE